MEGAMAATSGLLAGHACLDIGRKKESMCSTSTTVDVRGSSFPDRSHLQYYGRLTYCGKKNKLPKQSDGFSSEKKRIALLDGLAKDLSALRNSLSESNEAAAATPSADNTSLADQVRGRILLDALQVVMAQLAQAKAERKERERQLKTLKKAALKARKVDSAPPLSPSESSDSDCKVVGVSEVQGSSHPEETVAEHDHHIESQSVLQVPMGNGPEGLLHLEFGSAADRSGKRELFRGGGHIGVCMGAKCRKMGSCQLLSAFEGCVRRKGGLAVEAVGCKCMGKCRNAPNVKVQKCSSHGDDISNQLHLGVGVEDVDFIVSYHFGQQFQSNALVPA